MRKGKPDEAQGLITLFQAAGRGPRLSDACQPWTSPCIIAVNRRNRSPTIFYTPLARDAGFTILVSS